MKKILIVVVGIILVLSGISMAAGVTGLGSLDNTESEAQAISGNGIIVVGSYGADIEIGAGRAYLWTLSGGMVDLGVLDGAFQSEALGVSADGSVIVGTSGLRAFRWTPDEGMTDIGHLFGSGVITKANAVSADGKVIVGAGIPGTHWTDYYRAFRWTEEGGFENLGTLGGSGADSHAFAVSADGRVVVGWAFTDATRNYNHAFRWVEGETGGVPGNRRMFDLGTLGGLNSQALGVSADGSVVVGNSQNSQRHYRAFRWVEGATGGYPDNPQMFDLGTLGGVSSTARGVSADGKVVVGSSLVEPDNIWADSHAYRWSEETGMQSIVKWLADAGTTVTGWHLEEATGTNDDGSVVVGNGIHPGGHEEAWIARVGEGGSDGGNGGLVTPTDLNQSLAETIEARRSSISAIQTLLSSTRGRPLVDRLPLGSTGVWAVGDWGSNQRGNGSNHLRFTGIGLGKRWNAAQVNAFIGTAGVSQKLSLDGTFASRGTYVVGEVMGPVMNEGKLWGVLTGFYMTGDARILRAYTINGGTRDQSKGEPSLSAAGMRLRMEWDDESLKVRPYVDLSHSRVRLAAYAEEDGAFPARFDEQIERATELRLGLGWGIPLSPTVGLIGNVEGVHRFEKTGSLVSGRIPGVSHFQFAGEAYDRNWISAGVGVDVELDMSTVSAMVSAATRGETPAVLMSVSWNVVF